MILRLQTHCFVCFPCHLARLKDSERLNPLGLQVFPGWGMGIPKRVVLAVSSAFLTSCSQISYKSAVLVVRANVSNEQ